MADRRGIAPTIWKDPAGFYVLFVPLRWLKQLLGHLQGRGRSRKVTESTKDAEVPGIEFRIWREETVAALDEYTREGWSHAKAVKEGRTRRLYLSSNGEPFGTDGFGAAFRTCKTEAAHFLRRSEGREVKCHNRKQHRAIIGATVELHCPGHQLKGRYLTHSSDFRSDGFYSQANMQHLSENIHEILAGLPTRPEQVRLREEARDKQLAGMQKLIEELHGKQAQQGNMEAA
jgi:hypothetical protein